MFDFDVEAVLDDLQSRIVSLESRVEEQDALIEELRYAGPVVARNVDFYEDAYGPEGEWDAL